MTTSARRLLDGSWTTDRWHDYRPKRLRDWVSLTFFVAAFAGGILIGLWASGGF